MNIFEDLVEELKEENLLEETVIETSREKDYKSENGEIEVKASHAEDREMILDIDEINKESEPLSDSGELELSEENHFETVSANEEVSNPVTEIDESEQAKGVEFYRQRAMKEVSGLQMVEHVLSGVEREQMKLVSKSYDDLEAKKILHMFLQVSQDLNSPEHAQAEFKLMQETESWYSALSHRDRNISVTHLRRYCETTKPILSSQALISLARFYRNSPFSEQVRSKFDLVITRLFAKEIGDEKRQMVFERDDMMKHLTMLYGEWASIPIYSASEDDSEILLTALKFEEFMQEAESAESFDELIKKDFFNRLRMFKESANENFFAPLVTSAAIECNVRVGNHYVYLIELEREKSDRENLEDKYGFLHDQAISEAASKTLQLVELLKERAEIIVADEPEKVEDEKVKHERKASVAAKTKKAKTNRFAVNKWLLAATIFVVVVNLFLYFTFGGASNAVPESSSQNVQKVNLDNSFLKDFIREGRISNETFFALTQPSWAGLSKEKKEDVLKKIFATAGEKGFNKVQILDSDGKPVGFANKDLVEVY
jgi:hypothetical protein